jgi:diadenosine tetraphosphate (Ap4A) HIT family hydrolase
LSAPSAGHQVPRPTDCALCLEDGGELLARGAALRVVLIDDPDHPAYLRVIWNEHVVEVSDLAHAHRAHLMAAVNAVETALRQVMHPDKINLASLGNQVPHVHWHVIARFVDDAHFPHPIWAARQREPSPARLAACRQKLPELRARIIELLAAF